jgi:4-hydroxybenzoate polyprenyltransferase/phosphoserine phosphatase
MDTQYSEPPLCVDLDGTLIKTDLLIESCFALIKQNLLAIFLIPVWLLQGKSRLKQEIARRVELDVTVLPYQLDFLAYLREEQARGRRLMLVTASPMKFARQVAEHLGLFDDIIATEDNINLSGKYKRERLEAICGKRGFAYAGNARVDLAIWPYGHEAILVNPGRGVHRAASKLVRVARVFDDRTKQLPAYLHALRLHQWLKNILVFVPLFAAHRVNDISLLIQALVGFLAFGLCASSVYVLNDLLDLAADRHHPYKRERPFASGRVLLLNGAMLVPVLLTAAFAMGLWLPSEFLPALGLYYALTLAYSLKLKQIVMLDVLVLAGLYTMRIIAGAAAVEIVPSFWLLAFSMFIFLSLAMVKRYSELVVMQRDGQDTAAGRGYQVDDLIMLQSLGAASGNLSVLVLALYINSTNVQILYSRPEVIWLLCPLLLYWISRVWLKTHRGEMHDDPVIFATQDRVSRVLAVVGGIILWMAV